MRSLRAYWRLARRRVCRARGRERWQEHLALLRHHAPRAAGVSALVFVGFALWCARFSSPPPTFLLHDRQGRFLGEVCAPADGELGYWPVEKLPPRVVAATLAIEDRRFALHSGVDALAVLRAARDNVRHRRRVSGASTLAMQVARMQRPGARGYGRKAFEAVTACFMTAIHGRNAVLAQYLRIVPYGNRIHGIGYAARRYLDKPVEDLSWAEIAFLSAIPQSPARMNPFVPSGRLRAVARGQEILKRLLAQGVLTQAEHELASKQIEVLQIPPLGERPRMALHALLRLEHQLGDSRARAVFAQRPIVATTLDLEMQDEVAWIVQEAVQGWRAQGAGNAAAVVLDRRTLEVLAWVGSADYFDAAHAGAIDFTGVPRSPGSALKPFVYALALERGVITPATVLDDLERGAGGITNADDLFLGPLLPRVALGNSRNVPAADLLARVGVDQGYGFMRDLGLHEGREPARRYGLGLAIGGLAVTLEQLIRAYGVLSLEGRLADIRWFEGQARSAERQVLSEDTARQVALFLSDPMARLPSFARMGAVEYPFPVAVKTGTSSRFRDAWTVGFSTRYLVGVWVGDPDFHPMNRLTGYRSAAELAKRIFLHLHRGQTQGLDDLAFPPPRGFDALRVCSLTGTRANEACDGVFLEYFRPGEAPEGVCQAHVRVAVDTRTGARATADTPRRFAEIRTFVELAPRYAAWAASAGLPRPPSDGLQSFASAAAETSAAHSSVRPVRVSVTAPESGVRLLRDPETPADAATLALRAVVDPPTAQVVWYVDGQPYEVVDYPYTARWKLAPGEHSFQARVPEAAASSASVRVRVD
jgi:penicillin-binding protein 1C